MIVFNFYYYELPSAFGHSNKIRRGIGASDGPDGAYAFYFHSLAMSITKENVEEVANAIFAVECGRILDYNFGDGGWFINVIKDKVVIDNENYENSPNGGKGVFSFDEFKWVFMAWWEFILLPDLPAGNRYNFALPKNLPCTLGRPSNLLLPS